MTSIVTDFKSIARKLNRQEQKAEFEAKEEQQRQSYANLYGVAVPFGGASSGCQFVWQHPEGKQILGLKEFGGSVYAACEDGVYRLPSGEKLKSLAHPAWPYTGTPFEWAKFVKVKI